MSTFGAGGGLILSAPASGSGKTVITLGILKSLQRKGVIVRSAKSGPDYIDPGFHTAATGLDCYNLDAWAMSPSMIGSLANGPELLIIEGAMGLFDGAPPTGRGATADLARILKLPVVLIVDVARQAQSVAALIAGFAGFDPKVHIAGVILNRLGSDRHARLINQALARLGIPVLGEVQRNDGLRLPSRHLGLVQASETTGLESFLDQAADVMEACINLDALVACARPVAPMGQARTLPPPAQNIAVAQDQAFAFFYPHLLKHWRDAGAEIRFFSPLNDEAPPKADLVYLPGGYPELHAGKLAAAQVFKAGLQQAGAVYGECGGYMVMGEGLVDAKGQRHQMTGLLSLETSFAQRKLHLGYRNITPLAGPWAQELAGHEFHYSTPIKAKGEPLFQVTDAQGDDLGASGLRQGHASGSYLHVICARDESL